ncbi:hypothetical protein AB4K20DRAFT_1870642 [Rhizopus microsporus]
MTSSSVTRAYQTVAQMNNEKSFAICNIYVVIVLSSFLFSRTKRYIQVGTRRTGHDDCLLHMPQKGGTVPLGFSWTHLNHHRNGDIVIQGLIKVAIRWRSHHQRLLLLLKRDVFTKFCVLLQYMRP